MLKNDSAIVGYLGFHGPMKDDAVEIGYGTNAGFEGNGYASEAAEALVNWAFTNDSVFFVEAESEADNAASRRVLEKLSFAEYSNGEESIRYVKGMPASNRLTFYICLGLCFGLSLSNTLFEHSSTDMGIGIAIGCALGASHDKKEKKAIADAWERRKARLG